MPDRSSHGKLAVVLGVATVVMVLALISAFVWPGWAMRGKTLSGGTSESHTAQSAPTAPSIKAKELPKDATALLKAMPDSVLNFARADTAPNDDWNDANPLEGYVLTYSTGVKKDDVTLTVAQWSSSDAASEQYDDLAKALTGSDLAQGEVKVAGKATGRYIVRQAVPAKGTQAKKNHNEPVTALWRNDTVLFQASGSKDSVLRFYSKFPL